MSNLILDASAVLAILNREPEAVRWEPRVAGASISAVNLAEVVTKLTDRGMKEEEIRVALDPLALDVIDFDTRLAYAAGLLRAHTKGLGLSLADRACLTAGQAVGLPVLTKDRVWVQLRVGVSIQLMA